MHRLLLFAASIALLSGSYRGAIADDERQTAAPTPPPAADAEIQIEVDEVLEKMKSSEEAFRNGRVVVVGPEGTRKTIELKDGGSAHVIRIESDGEGRTVIVPPEGHRPYVLQFHNVKVKDDPEESPIRYRIGVQCQDVPPALRSHLSAHVTIPEDAGVLIEDVHDDSPAEKAGLMAHDLLIKAEDKMLTSAETLQDVIQKSDGEPITFTGFRQGRPIEIEVTPQRDVRESRIRAASELEGLLGGLITADGTGVITSEGNVLKQQLAPFRSLQLQRVGPSVMLNRTPMLGDLPKVQQLNSAKAIKDLSQQLEDLSEQLEKLQSVVGELQTNEGERRGR